MNEILWRESVDSSAPMKEPRRDWDGEEEVTLVSVMNVSVRLIDKKSVGSVMNELLDVISTFEAVMKLSCGTIDEIKMNGEDVVRIKLTTMSSIHTLPDSTCTSESVIETELTPTPPKPIEESGSDDREEWMSD